MSIYSNLNKISIIIPLFEFRDGVSVDVLLYLFIENYTKSDSNYFTSEGDLHPSCLNTEL